MVPAKRKPLLEAQYKPFLVLFKEQTAVYKKHFTCFRQATSSIPGTKTTRWFNQKKAKQTQNPMNYEPNQNRDLMIYPIKSNTNQKR